MNEILIVSPDNIFSRMLFLELKKENTNVKSASTKTDVRDIILWAENSDLVVYDADFESGNTSILMQINTPCVLFSKERPDNIPQNVVRFFERPFDVSKFVAFVYSHLTPDETPLKIAPQTKNDVLSFDRSSKRFVFGDEPISLSPKEYALLSLLYKNRGQVVLRKDVLNAVWGEDYDDKNNVDNVYVSYLRKKLDDAFGVKMIYTVRGKGYMLK